VTTHERSELVGTFGRYLIFAGTGILVSALTLFVPLEAMFTPQVADYTRIGIFVVVLIATWFLYDICPQKVIIPLGLICWIIALALVFRRAAIDW
jgi:hypothetical protein